MKNLRTFPLNALDINFLLSSDGKTLDLPNTIVLSFHSKTRFNKIKLVDTLFLLDQKFPELKLSTTFLYESLCWQEVPTDKKTFFSGLVSKVAEDAAFSPEKILTTLIHSKNYHLPFEITISENYFFYRQNHVFADGMFAMRLLEMVMMTYFSESNSVGDVVLAPPLNFQYLDQNVLHEKARERLDFSVGQTDFHVNFSKTTAPSSSKHQEVCNFVLSKQQMVKLEELRNRISQKQQISINTLLNVFVSFFFAQKKKQNKRTYLSIPSHLGSYFSGNHIYPYNFITNIDAYIDTPQDLKQFVSVCNETQAYICGIQKNGKLLDNVRFSMKEYSRFGKQMVEEMQQKYLTWYNNIEQTFVISNLGIVDDVLPYTIKNGVQSNQLFISAPCIGAQPLTIFITRARGQMNISCTVDTSQMSRAMVNELWFQFSVENLEMLIKKI